MPLLTQEITLLTLLEEQSPLLLELLDVRRVRGRGPGTQDQASLERVDGRTERALCSLAVVH
jgi:hypothetical protein